MTIGPTGETPITNLPNDKGGLNVALGVVSSKTGENLLSLTFGAAVTFVAMTIREARAFAQALLKKADEVDNVADAVRKARAFLSDPGADTELEKAAVRSLERALLEQAEVQARELAKTVREKCPGWGFVLILSSYGEGGYMTYQANVERRQAVHLLRELAGKLEAHAKEK